MEASESDKETSILSANTTGSEHFIEDERKAESEFQSELQYFAEIQRTKRSAHDKLRGNQKLVTVAADKHEFNLDELNHFSSYIVYIRACRQGNYTHMTTHDLCSSDVKIIAKTLKNEHADDIDQWSVRTSDAGERVNITWSAPRNPNGFVLNYIINLETIGKVSLDESICVPHSEDFNSYQTLLRPGNYSIKIAAKSTAGLGRFTSAKYFYISSVSYLSLILSPAFMAIVFLFVASIIAVFVFVLYQKNQAPENVHNTLE